jgi:DNA helicase-2/ATP-dependent DNA helicase PcrA
MNVGWFPTLLQGDLTMPKPGINYAERNAKSKSFDEAWKSAANRGDAIPRFGSPQYAAAKAEFLKSAADAPQFLKGKYGVAADPKTPVPCDCAICEPDADNVCRQCGGLVPSSYVPQHVKRARQGGLGLAGLPKVDMRRNTHPHVIVVARAGTGKTTTLIEGLKRIKGLPTSITPSPQQAAVWEQMALSKDARSICFVAFNKAIATELQRRVPDGCDAMTMHSLGYRAVMKSLDKQGPNQYAVLDLICEELEGDYRQLRKNKANVLTATNHLVSLCKQNLILEPSEEMLEELCWYYDVELGTDRAEVFGLVPTILEHCKSPKGRITFDDMIWLPVALNLPTPRHELLLVDEAQDLNRCQQELALKVGERLIFVGDPAQSIYGFAGADVESIPRLTQRLSQSEVGCVQLPLTVTRRCGKAIVRLAQDYVPDFEAHESNGPGRVSYARLGMPRQGEAEVTGPTYADEVEDGDYVVCRLNAPLVSQCFKFLRQGRKAIIRGRDIGAGLVSIINKLTGGVEQQCRSFMAELSDWYENETAKEQSKKFPSENKITGIQDRFDCLVCFMEGCATTTDMIRKIEGIFSDDQTTGVMFSSIHKIKGLEAKRVFWLQVFFTGARKGKQVQSHVAQQERNLGYVATTRAIEELTIVTDEDRKGE